MDGSILLSLFCSYEEGFAWFRCTSDEFGNVTTNRRSVFESMPGTASDEPDVIETKGAGSFNIAFPLAQNRK